MTAEKRGLFFVVFALFLLFIFAYSALAEAGCYLYAGGDEDLYCQSVERVEAETDCDSFADCNMDQDFVPGNDCLQNSNCQQITCDVDCQTHARGWCAQLGLSQQGPAGQEVPVSSFNDQCNPGCCRIIGTAICEVRPTEWECRRGGELAGVANPIFISGVTSQMQCVQQYCSIAVTPASLAGTIKSSAAGNPVVPGATITLVGRNLQTTSGATTGSYSFPTLDPGVYQLSIIAPNYNPLLATVTLSPGETAQQDFTLVQAAGTGTISGIVRNEADNLPLDLVAVSWTATQQVSTGQTGIYAIPNVPPGGYIVRASKAGYTASSQQVMVTAGQITPANFMLAPLVFQGVRGITYIDSNGNGRLDVPDQAVYDTRIYVDGVFRGNSHYPSTGILSGSFEISLSSCSSSSLCHELFASYWDVSSGLRYESTRKKFSVNPNQGTTENVLLTPLRSTCTSRESYNVQEFTASHVPGKREVRLQWAKPCSAVQGYSLTKSQNGQVVAAWPSLPLTQHFLVDDAVEWGQTYTYAVVALDVQGIPSPTPNVQRITLGNILCQGKYDEATSHWETFCLLEDSQTLVEERKNIYSCTDDNQLIDPVEDCSLQGQTYFCARQTQTTATCRDAAICDSDLADPFGLYATPQICYGSSTANPQIEDVVNFCYLDLKKSTLTMIDQCASCEQVQSCFDYQRKDACLLNSCLTAKCAWIDSAQVTPANQLVDYSALPSIPYPFVTPETGTGYCVEEEYEQDDQCSLCSSVGNIYENNYCTAEVCTSLGRCLSTPDRSNALTSCISCGPVPTADVNCESYMAELECTGGQSTENTGGNGFIALSEDSCSWGRCAWTGASCVKDGDANGIDDCWNRRADCRLDITPPTTTLLPAGFTIFSYGSSEVIFEAHDNKRLGAVEFCLGQVAVQTVDCNDFNDNHIAYPGRLSTERVTVNLLESSDLASRQINGETYKLRYYSKDEFDNQENVQELIIFIDNVRPQFEIKHTKITVDGVTDLTLYLENLNEPMSCTLSVIPILPRGGIQTKSVTIDVQDKRAVFDNLDAARVDVNVTCTDRNGNENSELVPLVFDLADDIDIIHPRLQGVVAETRIAFKVHTDRPATCELYGNNNQKLADFTTDENGRDHETPVIPGFVEREYAAEQMVVCYDLLTGRPFDNPDYFQFRVDFTPPETSVVLQEGLREVRPVGSNWEEFFVQAATVNFECDAEGFACDTTYYCLGDGCEGLTNPGFTEYISSVLVPETTLLCYYSTDVASNRVYNPICGVIRVEGYGITLEKPPMRYYTTEMWGVSNATNFTLQFFTKVPTSECRVDFTPNFNYDSLPPFKIKLPTAQGKYIFESFPVSLFTSYSPSGGIKVLYTKCKDGQGVLGPEQKINLEYDPTAPRIEEALANPNPVLEGVTTNLFVTTDDKTLCRYSDNSQGRGSAEYEAMGFAFPGEEEGLMDVEHKDIFHINFIGGNKTYLINVQCRNGADGNSQVEQITFNVDYAAVGNIISVYPNDQYLAAREVALQVATSKNAQCSYQLNASYHPLDGAGTTSHTIRLTGLVEKEYVIPLRCVMGDHEAEAQSKFTVDLTPPKLTKVDDGNYTCGSAINVFVSANETKMGSYSYEVLERGTGNISSGATRILSGNASADQPITIPAASLQEGHRYTVKVTATDAAGNVGTIALESDGVLVVPRNYSACAVLTGPRVETIVDDSSCSSISVELKCSDALGCRKILYGTNPTSTQCIPSQSYSGSKIKLEKTEFICYYVENNVGKNYTDKQKIVFADDDGDGIANSCDICSGTSPGKIVGEDGCSKGIGGGIDTDKDGLSDLWEETFNSLTCPFDRLSADTDGDGLADNVEDYDGDKRTNYEESIAETNPCQKDDLPDVPPEWPPAIPEKNTLAWIFLIIGLVFVFGGVGYLMYYYRFASRTPAGKAAAPLLQAINQSAANVVETFQRLSPFQRTRTEKTKQRQREELFGAFTTKSSKIPHVGDVLDKKTSNLPKLQELAEKYAEHKDEIKQGLRAAEKGIFTRLEQIAKQTADKPIHEVSSSEEAKDIFSKLRNISKRRKQ